MDEKRLGAGRLVAVGIDTPKGRHALCVVDELQREVHSGFYDACEAGHATSSGPPGSGYASWSSRTSF